MLLLCVEPRWCEEVELVELSNMYMLMDVNKRSSDIVLRSDVMNGEWFESKWTIVSEPMKVDQLIITNLLEDKSM